MTGLSHSAATGMQRLMFRPADILIDAYLPHLAGRFQRLFPQARVAELQGLERVGRLALTHTARTDALYTNLEGTLQTVEVLLCILDGRQMARSDLAPRDWLQMVAAGLVGYTGFARGALPGDDGLDLVVDPTGHRFQLPVGRTDGCLLPVFLSRSKAFVHWHLRTEPEFDCQRIIDLLDFLSFPTAPADVPADNGPGPLLGAAQVIAQAGDPRFHQRMPRFYRQLEEAGMAAEFGFTQAADVRTNYPRRFWELLLPRISMALRYLRFTAEGQLWLARMNGHMLQAEHARRDTAAFP